MKFKYQSEYHPVPQEPNDYVSEGVIEIVDWSEDGVEHVIGRIALDCIEVPRVLYSEREHLYHVCDADSQGWHNVFAALFDCETCEFIPEVGCSEPFDFLYLFYRMELHPVIRHLESFVLHHVARINGDSAILTMPDDIVSVTERELSRLGFRKVAQTDFSFLPVMLKARAPEVAESEVLPNLGSAVDYTSELDELWNAGVHEQ